MSKSTQWHQLAINGGIPVRREPPVERRFLGPQALDAVQSVLESGNILEWYGGPMVRAFERAFSEFHGRKYGVLMSSGTAALHTSYYAIDVKPGDEIIVPALGFVADVYAALQLGGVPVYADIDPLTWVLDPKDVQRKITGKTKAVLAIHMFGQPVNMPGLVEIAKRHGLVVVEDCGQAHGSRIEGRLVGTFGDIGTYSLAARKHVTTGGQGGINILDNAEWASRMRTLVHHGKVGRYDFVTFAENYQITEVQAALGLVSFRQLDEEIARYRRNAAELKRRLTGINLEFDVELPGCFHSRFKVAFLLPKEYGRLRNWFSRALTAEGAPNMYYPLLTDIEWMRKYPYRDGECLVATDVCSRLITIPTALEEDLIVDVAEAVAKVSSCLDIAMAEVPCD